MKIDYDISTVAPYINWVYYFHAWQVREPREQMRMQEEAQNFLQQLEGRYHTHALFVLADAHAEGDDVVVDNCRLPMLRQQALQSEHLCLADFVSPVADRVGLFAATTDAALPADHAADPYQAMMAQLLADRLAEATVERLHEQVRKELWGYAPDEQLTMADMLQERFQGIRPAVGYPSLPDTSLNFLLDDLLHLGQIGITLTENGAMRPHASVSGLMLAHPQARYFTVGKIGQDQLTDYARRRGMDVERVRKFLSANLS